MEMATATEVMTLRLTTDLECTDPPYTDEYMSAMIDEQGSVELAAVTIWRIKAAQTAGFVDTTESGSTRRLSQLTDQSLKMARAFQTNEDGGVVGFGAPFTIGSERV
jgi:hypothetical protein